MAETGLNLHPEAKALLDAKLWEALESDEEKSIEKLRKAWDEIAKVGGVGTVKDYEGTREEVFVDSKEVDGGIPVYVYKPRSADNKSDGGVPILVYFHGGGSVLGSRDLVDDTCKILSSQAGCIVVNVEYRLAPEHKFPAMMNDAYDAVRWVLDNRSLIGGTSTSKVGVSGDSAGGQIAASVSHNVPGVDFQILVYPWLSIGNRDLPSHEQFKNGPAVTEDVLTWIESQVVENKEDLLDPRLCLFRNEKYDHLPPTLFFVAEFDMIRDESYEYSKRLTAAGVDNEVFQANGAIHGYFTDPGGIPVYVYKPKPVDHGSDGGVPILVYFHGGGNIMGSRDICDNTCKVLSGLAGCIVVNVEYRLAPEHKFPAMMNDGYEAVRWVQANRSLVGGTSKSKVGVAGDSAGGQIAASVSHHVPGVDFQILVYPWLSPGEEIFPSHEEFKNGPLVQEGFTAWLETQVVEKRADLRDPKFHALRNEKFDHLPPTLLIVAEYDQLRDESYEYSKRLTAAGVDSEVYLAKGAIHGFFSSPGSFPELGGQAYAKAAEFIKKVGKQH